MGKLYKIGTPEQQEYLRDYNFNPKGLAFSEPGVIGSDAKEFVAFNIAKSFYQVYPEVFNLPYVEKVTGIPAAEAKKRIKRLYDEKKIMLVKNSAVSIMGFGLYYWVVKLKDGISKKHRQELTDWFQSNDQICTGYMMEEGGDFDYFNGNHMRVQSKRRHARSKPQHSIWITFHDLQDHLCCFFAQFCICFCKNVFHFIFACPHP